MNTNPLSLLRWPARLAVAVVVCVAWGGQVSFAQAPAVAVTWQAENIYFIPPLVQGDGEFYGHGPDVTWSVTLWVNQFNRHEIWATVWVNAVETQSDFTTAQGSYSILVATSAVPIASIAGQVQVLGHYVDTNHAVDVFPNPGGFLREVRIVGDTKGDEAGTKTRIDVTFNTILVYCG